MIGSIFDNAYIGQVINYYGPRIYELLGIGAGTSLEIQGISGSLSIIYCAIGLYLLDKIGRGNSISTLTNWCLKLLFAQISPIALGAVGFRFFYAFFVFNICAALCYIFLYPETKGKTLEQMDELFGDQIIPHALKDSKGAERAMSVISAVGVERAISTSEKGGVENRVESV